jgi:hypothetical protein
MRRIGGDCCLQMPPRTVTASIIAHASEGRRHRRSRLRSSRSPQPLGPRADAATVARAYGSHGRRCACESEATRRHRLGTPLKSHAVGSRRRAAARTSRGCSRRQAPKS